MAEPARKTTARKEHRLLHEEPGITLLRWVERPGGRMEQVELPLTPELFLNPQFGDQWMQGRRHGETAAELALLLRDHFRPALDVLVLFDVKHLFGPGLPEPSPDVSVIRGIRDKEADRESFSVKREGAAPCLIFEVVSPLDAKIRRTDLRDKVDIYARARVQEYLILDSTRRDRRFRLLGHRLDGNGRYLPIEPDGAGRIFSESLGLWFQVTPDGQRVRVLDFPGERLLLTREEERERADREAQARQAAEEKARQEAQARQVAEAEVLLLKTELDRLRRGE